MANTLAYYDMATITAVKGFIVQAPGVYLQDKIFYNRGSWKRMWYQIKPERAKAGDLKTS